MQKENGHPDTVWGLCAELLTSGSPCLVAQGAVTLRSLLGIPIFRQVIARATPAKIGVGTALPHMASWPPSTRSIHAALQLLFTEHSDERVLQDVLVSLQLLLAASFGGDAVVSVCSAGGPSADNKTSASLWQLVSRLTVLSLHHIPSLACDSLVTLSLLTSNAAGCAVCVLNRAASLLLWQVMCRCLQVISPGSAEEVISEQSEALPEKLQQQISGDVEQQEATLAEDGQQQQRETTLADDGQQQQQEATLADDGQQQQQEATLADDGQQQQQEATLADDGQQQQQEATLADDGQQQQQQESTLDSQRPSVKAFARRKFMSDVVHGSCQHSFLEGCNLTCEAYLLQSGVVELLLYCSMHACINCSTVCVSMKRVQSKDSDSSPTTALFSCSFGCTAYAQSYCLFPL
jgi:hypothetical protein